MTTNQLAYQNNLETIRHNQATEGLQDQTIATTRYGIDLGAETTRRGQDLNYAIAGMQNETTKRGQDMTYSSTLRGQDLVYDATTRGQDINAETTKRGQDINAAVTTRGQDLNAFTTVRGQDINAKTTRRGQDVAAMTTTRGQTLNFAIDNQANYLKNRQISQDYTIGKSNISIGQQNAQSNAQNSDTNKANAFVNYGNYQLDKELNPYKKFQMATSGAKNITSSIADLFKSALGAGLIGGN